MKRSCVFLALCALGVFVILGSAPQTAPHYSAWSAPVHLDAPFNSADNEQTAILSKDSLSLYITSTRLCGETDAVKDANIWVATRPSRDAPWGELQCLEMNVDGYEDSNPEFSRDGHWMFFVSNRPGSYGPAGSPAGRDIWVSYRTDVHDDHAWGEPVNAGPLVNTDVADTGPTYFDNEGGLPQLIFASQRLGGTGLDFDLFVTDVIGANEYAVPRRIDELSARGLVDAGPFIRHDGLEIFWFRGPQLFDIYTSTRATPDAPWAAPIRVDEPISSPANEQAPKLSPDGETLFFVSTRAGTLGGLDIWATTRSKKTGHTNP